MAETKISPISGKEVSPSKWVQDLAILVVVVVGQLSTILNNVADYQIKIEACGKVASAIMGAH